MHKTIVSSLENSQEIIKFLDQDYSKCLSYNKFLLVWMSFNSFYYNHYPQTKEKNGKEVSIKEKEKVIMFVKDNSSLFDELINKEEFKNVLIDFGKTGCGKIRKTVIVEGYERKEVFFWGRNNKCIDFFKVLYQIRCNLIHGGKNLNADENKKLVSWAYKYLNIFWRKFIDENIQ